MTSKFETMQDYLQPCITQIFGRYLYMNNLPTDSVCFTIDSQDMANQLFIGGKKDISMRFVLVASLPLSEYKDDINADAMQLFEDFKSWIEAQEESELYPSFDGCNVYEILPEQNFANFNGVSDDGKYAEYRFAVTVNYIE